MINQVYHKLLVELDNGRSALLLTRISGKGGKVVEKSVLIKDSMAEEDCDDALKKICTQVLESGKIQLMDQTEESKVLIEPFYPPPRLIILGGGHIAVPLTEFGARCGFEIIVVDDRPTFANPERFPMAKQVICDSFENCFKRLSLNTACYVVIVTRGHRHDMICLSNVMKHETAYAGMIGSKRRVAIVKQNLIDNGFSSECLDRLNAPIGLPIGAVTPEEIAISILSQVIAARRIGRTVLDESARSMKGKSLEFDVEVIEKLAEVSDEVRAVVTIISTKGSSPRHAGAKMIVYPDGRILGSIGGGCAESEVILLARDLMNESGGCRLHKVEMTDDAAEAEGMVCGGTMEVLIEA